jgi:hypothetical protein
MSGCNAQHVKRLRPHSLRLVGVLQQTLSDGVLAHVLLEVREAALAAVPDTSPCLGVGYDTTAQAASLCC